MGNSCKLSFFIVLEAFSILYIFVPSILIGILLGPSFEKIIWSLLAYVNALLIFFVVLKLNNQDFKKLKKKLFW